VSDARRARLPWVVWAVALAMLGATMVLSTLNGSFSEDPFFISIAIAMMLGYDTIGAIVASRDPRNALGWLMMWIGTAFVVAGFIDEYAKYAYLTHPGGLPFRLAAGWVSNWEIVFVVAPIPLLLCCSPTAARRRASGASSPLWRSAHLSR
jgi:hypothetical protein